MAQIVYLNGKFLDSNKACVSVLDRGFIFGDGVYEVIPAYANHLFRLNEHIQRLYHSLAAIGLDISIPPDKWQAIIEELLARNGVADWSIYLQITRGVARRDHVFPPAPQQPTVFIMCNRLQPQPREMRENGIAAITLADNRWQNCQIKAISLLPNILLKQKAWEQGCQEAILHRGEHITEGAASNVFMVKNQVLYTPPKSNHLLPGITRDLVVYLAEKNQIPVQEQNFSLSDLKHADEIWLTSSTKEIMAVTRLDGQTVGTGKPGALWAKMMRLYQDYKQVLRQGKTET